MNYWLLLLLGIILGSVAYHGATDLERRYAAEDRV